MRRLFLLITVVLFTCSAIVTSFAAEQGKTFLVHLKTGLKKDDAQICVAYNVIWAALKKGHTVKVLVDADAINTYKIGWGGKDDIEEYKIPENLRVALSKQFEVSLNQIPKTYGEYLIMLKEKGVEFFINSGFLIVSKIGTPEDLLKKISAKFFKPITLPEMIDLRSKADYYMVY